MPSSTASNAAVIGTRPPFVPRTPIAAEVTVPFVARRSSVPRIAPVASRRPSSPGTDPASPAKVYSATIGN